MRDEGISLVGLDTAAVVFGGNENFRGQVTSFMRALVAAAVGMNGAIILNAHPSKSGPNSYSGSTAWLASARFALSLGRPADYDEESGEPRAARVLRGLGANYSAGLAVAAPRVPQRRIRGRRRPRLKQTPQAADAHRAGQPALPAADWHQARHAERRRNRRRRDEPTQRAQPRPALEPTAK